MTLFRKKEKKKRKVYAVRRYNGSFCTQKQPEKLFILAVLFVEV